MVENDKWLFITKSNFLPLRDSVVSFHSNGSSEFLIIAVIPTDSSHELQRLILRSYTIPDHSAEISCMAVQNKNRQFTTSGNNQCRRTTYMGGSDNSEDIPSKIGSSEGAGTPQSWRLLNDGKSKISRNICGMSGQKCLIQ
eukprot:GHVL01028267.1.p1 GENE.GHVL01028267.1~~GHVL01028267.1.p1  ORF type:complete len:141 (-),score=23.14 GHVL01028267.1:187-609(-)